MPSIANIKAISISEQQLAPHLRIRGGGGISYIDNSQTSTALQYAAGEDLELGNVVYLKDDNKLYKADVNTHSADYITLSSASIGGLVNVSQHCIFEPAGYSDGQPLFLSTAGTLSIDYPSTANQIYQLIGIVNNSTLIVNIGNYYIIE